MYGRAPRALTVAITGTADDVGPGTYWPFDGAAKKGLTGERLIYARLNNFLANYQSTPIIPDNK